MMELHTIDKHSSLFLWSVSFEINMITLTKCNFSQIVCYLSISNTIEQHVLDTYAGKQFVLSCHRCLNNTGVEKINNI
jgi:hypothetical protein